MGTDTSTHRFIFPSIRRFFNIVECNSPCPCEGILESGEVYEPRQGVFFT